MNYLSFIALLLTIITVQLHIYLKNKKKLENIKRYKNSIEEIQKNYIEKTEIIMKELNDYLQSKQYEGEIKNLIEKNNNNYNTIVNKYKNKLDIASNSIQAINQTIETALTVLNKEKIVENLNIYNIEDSKRWDLHQETIYKLLNKLDSGELTIQDEVRYEQELKTEIKLLSESTDLLIKNWY